MKQAGLNERAVHEAFAEERKIELLIWFYFVYAEPIEQQ
jgi:hypothetical protein